LNKLTINRHSVASREEAAQELARTFHGRMDLWMFRALANVMAISREGVVTGTAWEIGWEVTSSGDLEYHWIIWSGDGQR